MNPLKNTFRLIIILLFTAVTSNDTAAQKDSITKVFIIRHAEKADDGSKDPPLSGPGKIRAAALAKTLSKTPVHGIYSTPYKRTRETVAVISAQSGIAIENYNPMDVEAIHSLVLSQKGKTLVLVGHSNTVPLILNKLTQSTVYKNLPETEFDNIWLLLLKGTELVDLIHLTY
jgi:broad specificity phosphatase PhoE